jgi:hypothetical protein
LQLWESFSAFGEASDPMALDSDGSNFVDSARCYKSLQSNEVVVR